MRTPRVLLTALVLAVGAIASGEDKAASAGKCETALLAASAQESAARAQEVDWSDPLLQGRNFKERYSSDSLLWKTWKKAFNARAEIERLVKAMTGPEKSYFSAILNAVDAALTKHQANFASLKSLDGWDASRHLAILRAIAGFEPAKARFSLYKIKRVIEGRYSLREYSECE